ncbi:cell division control protein 48 homolog C [Aristolochia californica]|uniref:cell division control protein 48 homolog C n=1 Tax=Aristolochia californica TaxID=171875 RepID=UPI0035DCEC2F
MGKKTKGGTRSPSDRAILLRRIKSCNLDIDNLSVDQIVEHLRSHFPDYCRIKQQPFTRHVLQTLQHQKLKSPYPKMRGREDDEDCEHDRPGIRSFQSPARKKIRKSDLDEERLAKTESKYLRRRLNKQCISSQSNSSSDEGGVSTSEDAIFEEPFEPEVDLMKSLLRTNYSVSKPVSRGKADGEKILEVEMVEKARKIDSMEVVRDEKNQKDLKGISGGKFMEEGPMFRDLAGMEAILDELLMQLILPLMYPELPSWLGVEPMTGILLHGPPGCGKTKLAHAIANETGLPFYKISSTEVVSGVSGASEENIRDLFSKAYRTAPSIIFIDEIDAIASKRENLQREMERRIVTELMTCMDESNRKFSQAVHTQTNSEQSDRKPGYVLVIGATNRPDAVDPALRRPGRFDREIVLGVPDENARMEILSVITRKLRLEGAFDLRKIARLTPGFVGADLVALAKNAGYLCMERIFKGRKTDFTAVLKSEENNKERRKHPLIPEEMERLSIIMADFEEAAKLVQPSLRREGFTSIPNVKWDDVGGLSLLRQDFDYYIVSRIKHPEDYAAFPVELETSFLLYGPPGCGKTLIAKAVANEAGANFIHIKGPEILNKYVGESELAIRTMFARARSCAPCIVFFDEIDALTTERGKDGGWVTERVLNQLLIELDGGERRKGVFVIGATNRLEVIDRAILRPGRLGKLLYVPLPSPDERGLILKAKCRKMPVAADVDLDGIGRSDSCNNLSGADLAVVVNEAAMAAMKERKTAISEGIISAAESLTIRRTHFENALKKITPSVTDEQKRHYEFKFQSFMMG